MLSSILSRNDVFYENSFIILSILSLLKVDSFFKEDCMTTLIAQLKQIAATCAEFQSIKCGDHPLKVRDPDLMIQIDKLYRKVSWILGQTSYRMIVISHQPVLESADKKI